MEMFGPYRLDGEIGRGGMGEVHRAFDTKRERTVALKRLAAGLATDEEYRERFRRESRLAARLSSPHVIPIHDFGEIDDRLYIDMRLVPGRDLAAAIAADGPLHPYRAVETVRHVADALDSAHEAGMVHRDVKPSNILVSTYRGGDFSYLLDFGIVRSIDSHARSSLTSTGAAIGTLAYMAPEVFAGDGFDHRVDVYALSCVLFEALTGRKPFDADGGPGLMYQHLHAPPPRLTDHRPDLPAAIGDVVGRGMAKNPADRPSSAGELAAVAARSLFAGPSRPPTPPPVPTAHARPPGGTPPPSAPSTPPPPRRRRRRVLVALGVVLLLAAGGVAAYLGVRATNAPPDTTSLRLAFPDIAKGGAGCRLDPDPPEETTANQRPVAVIRCTTASGAEWSYLEWASPADASLYPADVSAQRPRRDDGSYWFDLDTRTRKGPYYKVADGPATLGVGAYDDRRFGFVIRGRDMDAVAAALRDSDLPPTDRIPR